MRRKNVLCTIMAVMTAFILGGCGKQDSETPKEAVSQEDEYVYVAEYHTLNSGSGGVASAVIGEGKNIFYLGHTNSQSTLFSMDLDTMEASEIPITLEENQYFSGINTDREGNLLAGIICYTDTEPQKAEQVLIKRMTPDGKELQSLDVTDIFSGKADLYISDILMDKDENFHICTGDEIYIVKPDGTLYSQISPGQYISSFFSFKDGRIGAAYFDTRGFFAVNEVIPGKTELTPVDSPISFDYGVYHGGQDTDLLYTQGGLLLACDLSDEAPQEILRWTDYDVNSTNLTSVALLSDGRIAALTTDFMSENPGTELTILTKKKKSEVPEKIILTYGTYYPSFFAERDITAFNRQSQKYRIMIKEYGDASMNFDEKAELYLKELESGQFPDIIDLSYCPMPLETLISIGAVEDLTPYLDGDETINREDYVENALRAYERNGKLYAIMSHYGVDVLIGKTSEIGDSKTWTVDDVMELLSSREKGVTLLPQEDKSGILRIMCAMNQGLFVNKESGECNFTGEEFKKILEFCNSFPDTAGDEPTLSDLRSGKTLLNRNVITSVSQYQMYEYLFGGPVNLIGYPAFGDSGMTFRSNGTTVAMGANSENKEGVWEFIRFNITKERQENVSSPNGGFPILKSALEKEFEKSMESEYIKDDNGGQREIPKSTWASSMGGEEFSVDVFAATKEQVDQVRRMIDTAQNGETMDQEIVVIILEEASAYFSGQKSAGDVAAVIQNRVQLYLNETR